MHLAPPARRAKLWGVCLRLLALAATACSTPTLPLPPPTALIEAAPDAEGFVTVSGTAQDGARVSVFNEDREQGVVVVADPGGSYAARLGAAAGDVLSVWQLSGDDLSAPVTLTVPSP
jgi:hypothetical protein